MNSTNRLSNVATTDAITNERVQSLERHLLDRAPKTVNNVLTTLNVMLKNANEWDVIDRMLRDSSVANAEAIGRA